MHKYIHIGSTTIMVRVTGCKQKNFHHTQLSEAISYRDALCKQKGIDPYNNQNATRRLHTTPHKDKTSDLPVGFSISLTKRRLQDGTEAIYSAVRTYKMIKGKTVAKQFSVELFGYNEALRRAIKWRKKNE